MSVKHHSPEPCGLSGVAAVGDDTQQEFEHSMQPQFIHGPLTLRPKNRGRSPSSTQDSGYKSASITTTSNAKTELPDNISTVTTSSSTNTSYKPAKSTYLDLEQWFAQITQSTKGIGVDAYLTADLTEDFDNPAQNPYRISPTKIRFEALDVGSHSSVESISALPTRTTVEGEQLKCFCDYRHTCKDDLVTILAACEYSKETHSMPDDLLGVGAQFEAGHTRYVWNDQYGYDRQVLASTAQVESSPEFPLFSYPPIDNNSKQRPKLQEPCKPTKGLCSEKNQLHTLPSSGTETKCTGSSKQTADRGPSTQRTSKHQGKHINSLALHRRNTNSTSKKDKPDGNDKRRGRSVAVRKSRRRSNKLLACPFHILDPVRFCKNPGFRSRFNKCSNGFRETRNLLRHLQTVHHFQEVVCQQCMQELDVKQDRCMHPDKVRQGVKEKLIDMEMWIVCGIHGYKNLQSLGRNRPGFPIAEYARKIFEALFPGLTCSSVFHGELHEVFRVSEQAAATNSRGDSSVSSDTCYDGMRNLAPEDRKIVWLTDDVRTHLDSYVQQHSVQPRTLRVAPITRQYNNAETGFEYTRPRSDEQPCVRPLTSREYAADPQDLYPQTSSSKADFSSDADSDQRITHNQPVTSDHHRDAAVSLTQTLVDEHAEEFDFADWLVSSPCADDTESPLEDTQQQT